VEYKKALTKTASHRENFIKKHNLGVVGLNLGYRLLR